MKNPIKIVSIILALSIIALSACFILGGCGKKDNNAAETTTAAKDGETVATKGKLVLGFDSEFPPMGFVDETTGEYIGFDIDLAKEAAKRLGYELTLMPINWGTKDAELANGTIDMIWNGFTMHVEDNGQNRDDLYTWTEPYMKNAQVIVVRADSDITCAADLAGKTVATQQGSSGMAALDDNIDIKNSIGTITTVENYETALNDLEAGAVDAVVMDETVIGYKIAQGRSFKIVDESLADEEYGVAFLLGNTALRDEIQGALNDMAADGTMAKISNTWFSRDVTIVGK